MKRTANILIVEDSLTQAKRLERLLAENGYTVHVARNGIEGLAAAAKTKPSVIITDVMMPEMDGFEMCRCIKNDGALKDIPVVLLTSLSDPKDVIRGLQCGADNFLTKPYEGEHLLRRLEHVLTNLELRRAGQAQMTVEVFFAGQYHKLTADRIQIIDLLLSTFEAAVLQLEKLGGDYRNALEDVKRAQANFQTLMETTGDAVVVVEGGGTVIYVNPAAELLLHKDSAELVGKPFLFPLEGEGGHREVVIDLPNGERVVGDMRTATSNWDGELVRFATIRDVTEMVRLRELLEKEAVTDALTGLYNRRGFLSFTEKALQLAARMGFRATFLFADLDGFKNVNDTLGHEEGDEVLRETAALLRDTFRASDITGRIGGDEFAVLMLHDGHDEPGDPAGRLEEAVRRANGQRTREYRLSMSMGLSEWNPERPVSLGELMADADRRMYENKMAGKGKKCGE
ncbi:diguanylate cyclase [Aminivibrio sp.]|uniref:diguanylate cyclase n=1 Tax=Aminivibrio sp. TaxID=1872489 RepID=UPI00345E0F28